MVRLRASPCSDKSKVLTRRPPARANVTNVRTNYAWLREIQQQGIEMSKENSDGRKRDEREEREASASEQHAQQSVPGWQKARAARQRRDAKTESRTRKQSDGRGVEPLEELKSAPKTKRSMSVGGVVKAGEPRFDFTKTRMHTLTRPRRSGGFSERGSVKKHA